MSELTYQQAMELRFEMCLKRLVKLRELNAPGLIVANEVAMLLDRCALLYGGTDLWAAIGKRATARTRIAAGYCPECDADKGEVRRIKPGEEWECAECAARLDTEHETEARA